LAKCEIKFEIKSYLEQICRHPDLRVACPNSGYNGTFWTFNLKLLEIFGIYSRLLMQRFLCASVDDSTLLLNAGGRMLLAKRRADVDRSVKYTLGAICCVM